MKRFMDDDFLLENDTARHLFHDHAENLPIIDYHCHLSAQEIYEDIRFDNLSDLWFGGKEGGSCAGDHYKWRLMRSAGVDENYITGDASDLDKFKMWAKTLSLAVGSPLYEWSHLELKNYFGENKLIRVIFT